MFGAIPWRPAFFFLHLARLRQLARDRMRCRHPLRAINGPSRRRDRYGFLNIWSRTRDCEDPGAKNTDAWHEVDRHACARIGGSERVGHRPHYAFASGGLLHQKHARMRFGPKRMRDRLRASHRAKSRRVDASSLRISFHECCWPVGSGRPQDLIAPARAPSAMTGRPCGASIGS
ncbi:hypothetical protein OEW28_09600 [Defluviimonas sp. WL0002]|uniref:Uncharacterized protein n=1 Tax=Albidovulum marisflavi TaxID=2984159 RepID=A0ABT2ZCY9_9RHOB|nr:hypothetical protein [Defluviimonas sp. WL0002]MCV2868882.1 hypothetical protein [Defluviimonas sp. WL0002]